jgi:uncharacterized damage-inducible protein DinB
MFDRLDAHRDWANRRIVAWYLALPQPEEYCLKMLSHILLGEAVWLARLRGEPARGVWEVLSPEELDPLRRANTEGWNKVLASDMTRVFVYKRISGEECESVLADIFTHMCLHGTYHRGQISAQAARAGGKAPSTDFIEFSRV